MCDDCTATLTFALDGLITSKMIEILFTAWYADENILYFNENSGNLFVMEFICNLFVFICDGMGIVDIDFNNVNLNNTNYDEGDPDTNIFVRLFTWHIKFEERKVLKKGLNEELIPIAWHPNR